MDALALLDAALKAQGLPSDYALAARLGISRSAISNYRHGRSLPDDGLAARIAELAQLDPDAAVAAMHAQRAVSDAERARWQRIADRLERAAVTACAALALVGFSGGPDGGALARSAGNGTQVASGSLYIMSTSVRRWLRRRLRDFLPAASSALTINPA